MKNGGVVLSSLLFGVVGMVVACGGSATLPTSPDGGGNSSGSTSSTSSTSSSSTSSGSTSSSGGCSEPATTVVNVPVPAVPNGGRCGGVYADDMTCAACVNKNCCAQESACGTTASCVADLECTSACSSVDTACAAKCDQASDAGAGVFGDLRSCLSTSCATECATLAALTFDCNVVCVGHGPDNRRNPTSCRVLDPVAGTTTTLVECTFAPLPCDPATPGG